MRFLIQRVKYVNLVIDEKLHAKTGYGYLCYLAFQEGDNEQIIDKGLEKLRKLRIFEDNEGKMNKSITDINGEVMFISSFSLFADTKGSNRPSFSKSLKYDLSKPLYDKFIEKAKTMFTMQSGVFGADMKVESVNDGPVSIIMDI